MDSHEKSNRELERSTAQFIMRLIYVLFLFNYFDFYDDVTVITMILFIDSFH